MKYVYALIRFFQKGNTEFSEKLIKYHIYFLIITNTVIYNNYSFKLLYDFKSEFKV